MRKVKLTSLILRKWLAGMSKGMETYINICPVFAMPLDEGIRESDWGGFILGSLEKDDVSTCRIPGFYVRKGAVGLPHIDTMRP